MNFLVLGINYKKTLISLREKFNFSPSVTTRLLNELKETNLIKESLYLNTCNRAELYAVKGKNLKKPEDLINVLCKYADIKPNNIKTSWYLKHNEKAVEHLFRVTSSLDSMIIGEPQIKGQVKTAYSIAHKSKTTGSFINHATLHAFYTAKRIRSQTEIAQRSLSIASIACDLVSKKLKNLSDKTILLIGAGEIASLLMKNLKQLGAGQIIVTNRTFAKASLIAQHTGGTAIQWNEKINSLIDADIVVSAVSTKEAIINKSMFEKTVPFRKNIVIIDLGSPRNISSDVSTIPNVSLFNIDDLKDIARKNSGIRKLEAEKAKTIINEEIKRFVTETDKPNFLNIIPRLNQYFESIRLQELGKAFKKANQLSSEDEKIIEACTRSIISKIMHVPIKKFNEENADRLEQIIMAGVLEKLFEI